MISRYSTDYDENMIEDKNGDYCYWKDVEKLVKIAFNNGIFSLNMDALYQTKYLNKLYENSKEAIERDFDDE